VDAVESFDVLMPTRIAFGAGRLSEVGILASVHGKRAMLITYRDIRGLEDITERAINYLNEAGMSVTEYSEVEPDPPTEIINRGAEIARKNGIEVVIGLGGGSAIDTAKAIGVVAVNGGDAWDYMACNPACKKFSSAIPVIAIPTTAGTGSETTAVAVLTKKEITSKGSIVNPVIFPRTAIVDPELSRTMPSGLTASTGIDALGHAMESFISKRVTPYVARMAPEAIRLIWENLPVAFEDGDNLLARANMAWASTVAGMMLAQSGVIGVHAVAQALGAHLNIPHGIGVAVATPHFLEYNRSEASEKYVKIARELGIGAGMDRKDDIVDEFINQVKAFLRRFNMPENLKDRSCKVDKAKLLENSMFNAPLSLVNNPRRLTIKDMEEIFSRIL